MNAYCTWLDDLIRAVRARDAVYGYREWWDTDLVTELDLQLVDTYSPVGQRFFVKSATLLVEPWKGKCVGRSGQKCSLRTFDAELKRRLHGDVQRAGDAAIAPRQPASVLCVRWSKFPEVDVPSGWDAVSYVLIAGHHAGTRP